MKRVGVEQDLRRKEHVVDADDALFIEDAVVHKRRPAAEGEIERVMQVVIQVRAGADDEVDEAAFHQLDDAAAEARGGHRAGDGQGDGRVVRLGQHLVAEDPAGFSEACRIEGLKAFVDQRPHRHAAFRAVITNRLAFEVRLAGLGSAWGSVRHCPKVNTSFGVAFACDRRHLAPGGGRGGRRSRGERTVLLVEGPAFRHWGRVPRQPAVERQPLVSDPGPGHADQRRPLHAGADWPKRTFNPYRAHRLSEH